MDKYELEAIATGIAVEVECSRCTRPMAALAGIADRSPQVCERCVCDQILAVRNGVTRSLDYREAKMK